MKAIGTALVAALLAALSMAGCAVAPQSDGGIVGSGNRLDCEPGQKKERSQECRQ